MEEGLLQGWAHTFSSHVGALQLSMLWEMLPALCSAAQSAELHMCVPSSHPQHKSGVLSIVLAQTCSRAHVCALQ